MPLLCRYSGLILDKLLILFVLFPCFSCYEIMNINSISYEALRKTKWIKACYFLPLCQASQLPRWLNGKESTCNAGDPGLIPGLGRSPGGGNGSPLQYSCLGNPMDREAWWATVHGVTKELDTTERLINKPNFIVGAFTCVTAFNPTCVSLRWTLLYNKWKLREVKQILWGHTVGKQQSQDLD